VSKKQRLDVLVVERGLEPSRARAQARILAGEVVVDDHRVDKPGTKVSVEAEIRLKGDGLKWVSRGGKKLDGALDAFGVDPAGRVCLDVGASTGGFTDVLLTRGATRVYAVDVGYGQLAWKIRNDARVVNMERTHIGKLEPASLDPAPDLGVVDVSFISLTRVLPAMRAQLSARGEIVALIKPQFEVGKERIAKGGIVRDEAARDDAVSDVTEAAAKIGMRRAGLIRSPIEGADGNVEFLAHFVVEEPA
jgi:23S rRNA (cytidine1920-2'-O)/16S rRNA (cytidine1409-2'-O)-methyltransferase